MDIDRVTRS